MMTACRKCSAHVGASPGPHVVCPSCKKFTVDISGVKNIVVERVFSDMLCSGVSVSSTPIELNDAIKLLRDHPEATYYNAPDALHIEISGA